MNATVALDLFATGILSPVPGDADRLRADLPSPCVQNHAANLAVLRNGDLACVWFGGTQEGMADISIYFSRLPVGAKRWTPAVRLSDDSTRSEQNPILFAAPDGALWLLYTAQRAGHQDTAIVRCRVSEDDGRTWSPIRTLVDTPGTFVRQPIVVAHDGAWLLPVFHCLARPGERWNGDLDTSSVLVSTDAGRTWTTHVVPDSVGCVHMNIVPGREQGFVALFRSRWADRVYASHSDNGRVWSSPVPTSMPNNNASMQAIRLASGHLAMVCNASSAADATERRASLYDEIEDDDGAAPPVDFTTDAAPATKRTAFWGAPRAPLRLALSDDDGATWRLWRDLEIGDGYCMTNDSQGQRNREYSYPSIVQTPDGFLHIAYTVFRQKIRYVRVREDWVQASPTP